MAPVLSEMFNRAVMIVAPHGAGLANMLLAQPGTVVIEGVCYEKTRQANHCYHQMAQNLGLRYAAINYPTGCLFMQAADIYPVVNFYLRNLVENTT